MTTVTQTFPKKNLYHSNLVRHAGGGAVTLKIKNVMESKYPKPDCSHVAFLQFPEDEMEYSLMVENTTLAEFEKAPRDVWINAHPAGSATEPATVFFTQADGVPVAHQPEEAKPMSGPPPMFPDQPDPGIAYDAIDVAVAATVKAVKGLAAAGIQVDPTPIYSTHYIQASKR